ncbi:MAG: hypothetical protein JWO80_5959 [Bryobacterales bacterium]|nr:hypothetical protein [Bryobacterales bacterium]
MAYHGKLWRALGFYLGRDLCCIDVMVTSL